MLKFVKNSSARVVAVILLLLSIGLSQVDHYGISFDERVEIFMVRWNYELVTENKPIPRDLRYYGTVFNFSTQFLYEIKNAIAGETERFGSYRDHDWLAFDANRFKHLVTFKHGFTFVFSMIAYLAVAGIVSRLVGAAYAWIGPVALFFFPRFWGHSFFNPKDIPFAAMLTLGTYVGGCLIETFNQVDLNLLEKQTNKHSIVRAYIAAALYGCLVGLATGVRIGGLFLLVFVLLAHVATRLPKWLKTKQLRQVTLRFSGLYALMLSTWGLTTTAIHPAAWSNPVKWLIDTLLYLSDHIWSDTVLFAGDYIPAQSLPWSYLPTWLLITTPVFMLVAIVFGLLFIVLRYKTMNHSQKALILLVLLQITFLSCCSNFEAVPHSMMVSGSSYLYCLLLP